MRTHFSWYRQINGHLVGLGTLVVLSEPNGKPYLHVQVEDDHYDGVLSAGDLYELLDTVADLNRRRGAPPGG